jgi:hypothetical protein
MNGLNAHSWKSSQTGNPRRWRGVVSGQRNTVSKSRGLTCSWNIQKRNWRKHGEKPFSTVFGSWASSLWTRDKDILRQEENGRAEQGSVPASLICPVFGITTPDDLDLLSLSSSSRETTIKSCNKNLWPFTPVP